LTAARLQETCSGNRSLKRHHLAETLRKSWIKAGL